MDHYLRARRLSSGDGSASAAFLSTTFFATFDLGITVLGGAATAAASAAAASTPTTTSGGGGNSIFFIVLLHIAIFTIFTDQNGATTKLGAVQCVDGVDSFFGGAEFDNTPAFRTAVFCTYVCVYVLVCWYKGGNNTTSMAEKQKRTITNNIGVDNVAASVGDWKIGERGT